MLMCAFLKALMLCCQIKHLLYVWVQISAMCPSGFLTVRHGPALDARAEGSSALTGERLHPDIVGGVGIKALDGHVRFARPVGAVLLTVDVPVNDNIVHDLAVPFGHQRRVPGQLGAGLSQSRDLQVEREARRHVFRGADLFHVCFADARAVAGTEAKDIGGTFVQPGDGVVVIDLSQLAGGVVFLVSALVLQLVAHQLPNHFLRRLPLNQRCVAHSGADHHGGFSWH